MTGKLQEHLLTVVARAYTVSIACFFEPVLVAQNGPMLIVKPSNTYSMVCMPFEALNDFGTE